MPTGDRVKQRTLERRVSFDGPSVVSDKLSVVTLCPAPPDTGIVFRVNNVDIPAFISHLDSRYVKWTSLTKDGTTVHDIEHLLSALHGMGVTNAVVNLDEGNGIPILDGSAAHIVEVIRLAGIKNQHKAGNFWTVKPHMVSEQAIDFKGGLPTSRQSYLLSFPWPSLRVIYSLSYNNTPLGDQLADVEVNYLTYPGEVAPARTFMTTWEIERWRGTLLSNYFCDMVPKLSDKEMFEERIHNEAARHKVLDIVGDLALFGVPVHGLFVGIRSGHSLNKRMVREQIC